MKAYFNVLFISGRIRNGDRDENGDYKDARDEYDATIQEAMEYNRTHPKSYPSISSKNALKEKENVLLESIRAFKTRTLYDNKTRLGPDKENTFQNLKRSSSTSAMEQSTILPSNTTDPHSEPSSGNVLRAKSKSISLPQHDIDEIELPSRKILETVEDTSFQKSDIIDKEECDNKSVEEVDIEKICNINYSNNGCSEDNIITCNKEIKEGCQEKISNLLIRTKSEESSTSIFNSDPLVVELNTQNRKDSNTTVPQKNKSPLASIVTLSNEVDEGLEDCEEDLCDSQVDVDFVPLKLKYAIALKKLLLGSAIKSFSLQWMAQSFILSTNTKFRYGFVQNKVS